MKKIQAAELPNIPVGDIIDGLNQGAVIVNATLPILQDIVGKIMEWANGLEFDSLSLPKGKRRAIEALQAMEKIDQQKQELYDKYFAQLIADGVVKA